MLLNKQIVSGLTVVVALTMSACNTKKQQDPESEVSQTSVENPTVQNPKVTSDGLVIIKGFCSEGKKVELLNANSSLIDICEDGTFKFVISNSLSGLQIRQINAEGQSSDIVPVQE